MQTTVNDLTKELSQILNIGQKHLLIFAESKKLTDEQLLKIITGLGRKQLQQKDVFTAFMGDLNNDYYKKLLEYVNSDKAFKK